ncbi:MAG: PBP1A family penicillin-binding protein [Bryobacteraceae bacterium]
MKVRVPGNARVTRFFLGPLGRILVIAVAGVSLVALGVFTYYYAKYSRLIDRKLRAGAFVQTSKVYAAPRLIWVGDPVTKEEVIAELVRAGYTEARTNRTGYYHVRPEAVEIFPGPDSYFDQNEPGVIKFSGGRIAQIVSLADNSARSQFQLEPQLITNLFDRNREKRRLVRFADIPAVLINAVISAEDKRFFQHAGFDPIRLMKAIYIDLREGRKDQGASTLSQQLARGLWLTAEKSWKRKLAEAVITVQLEQKLSKEEIFEYYANHIYLGWRGAFRIHGFGEAAEVFFGKDIRQLNIPEAATLAGLIQRPSFTDPFRHPDRMIERRNVVLGLMRSNGYINDREYEEASKTPLNLARGANVSVDAPYFVDLVNETLQSRFQDIDFQSSSFRIYTTLDMDLQRAAVEAVRAGMPLVDAQLKKQRRFRGQSFPDAQVALVALDPHTGQIKALVGGRNYGLSQLNRVLAKRQPGSIFKPFVYAAALDTAIEGGPRIVTAGTTVADVPTTFWYDGKPYEPSNFKHEFHGTVTIRQALAKSMNVATVKVAEMIGYDRVVDVARRAGLNYQINPTPAVALGAYDVTPFEMAGAYTVFANGGVYVAPTFITVVRSQSGQAIYQAKPERREALDPRVAYLMTNLMEEVMRSGTAAGVRGRGFTVPAAGKTGTSRDGWFAGYTSRLLAIVWVGFDDNRELDLEGAHSALPIWTDFMKRALQYRPYRNVEPFQAPDGIVTVQIDPASGYPATPNCPQTRAEVYVAGTQPQGACPLHGGRNAVTNVAGWETTPPQPLPEPPALAAPARAEAPSLARQGAPPPPPVAQAEPKQEQKPKKSFFRRIWGVFK